jgi:hypothetical protein
MLDEWASDEIVVAIFLVRRNGKFIAGIYWSELLLLRIFYWTVRLTIVLWVIVPEVALMVIADVPAGVDGTKTLL